MYIYIILIIIILILIIYTIKYYNKLYYNRLLYESFINSEMSEEEHTNEKSETSEENMKSETSEENIKSETSEENIKSETINTNCDVDEPCSTVNGFGTYNKYCECIVNNNDNSLSSPLSDSLSSPLSDSLPLPLSDSLPSPLPSQYKRECIKNQDFHEYCKKINPNMIAENVIPCDSTTSEVHCSISNSSSSITSDTIITPCLDKMTDFDEWCKYYNHKIVPEGYNIDSIGAKQILVGEKGFCFTKDGKPNKYKARAICDNNHLYTIPKLQSDTTIVDYNSFTDCLPINDTNFVSECSKLLDNNPFLDTSAYQIMGYDCNPGFGRAKCIKKEDMLKIIDKNKSDNIFDKNIFT